MKKTSRFMLIWAVCFASALLAEKRFESDRFETSAGPLEVTFIGHGTLMMRMGEMVVHIDPVGRYADYTSMPKADLILITHQHGDHLDPQAINAIRHPGTKIIVSQVCEGRVNESEVLTNGQKITFGSLQIEAVPAYNLVHKRDNGVPFHPKGEGNGYVLEWGGKRVYVAGDTENIPEMGELQNIDIAFLPMNVPYTMTPEMVADAVDMFKPKVLYPYHFSSTNTDILVNLLKNQSATEVRIRNLQ